MSMRDCSLLFPPTTVKGEGTNKREMHYTGRAKAPADPCPAVAPWPLLGQHPGYKVFGRWDVRRGGSVPLCSAVGQDSALAGTPPALLPSTRRMLRGSWGLRSACSIRDVAGQLL